MHTVFIGIGDVHSAVVGVVGSITIVVDLCRLQQTYVIISLALLRALAAVLVEVLNVSLGKGDIICKEVVDGSLAILDEIRLSSFHASGSRLEVYFFFCQVYTVELCINDIVTKCFLYLKVGEVEGQAKCAPSSATGNGAVYIYIYGVVVILHAVRLDICTSVLTKQTYIVVDIVTFGGGT